MSNGGQGFREGWSLSIRRVGRYRSSDMDDTSAPPPDGPHFSDIDSWAVTHPGKVRQDNQDYCFVGAVARRGSSVEVVGLDAQGREAGGGERLASLGVVADGVGSALGGGEGARTVVKGLVEAVARLFEDPDVVDHDDPDVISRQLQEAALDCHESLQQRARDNGEEGGFATTLTLFLGLWPHAYLLQVGDSRCYVFHGGELRQISRDQTVAQELVDQGVITGTMAERSPWASVLSSAIGGKQAAPVVTRVVRDWGTVVLLCSDGLTRHVPDERIRDRLATMISARQVSEQLLQDALDDGGTDNVTIVVGRTVR